jgi:site-specific DNA-methyltransferase (adenine-specific)
MAEYMIFYVKDNSWKLKDARKRLGIKTDTISKEILSKTGGVTGWYNNIETGKNYPTEKTIVPITKYLGLTIDDIVPKFRNQKTHHSIWNYDIVKGKSGHITEKPLEVLENILKHTTDEGDLCLDCFAGSGSFGVACRNLKRNYTLIEKNEEYMKIIKGKGL